MGGTLTQEDLENMSKTPEEILSEKCDELQDRIDELEKQRHVYTGHEDIDEFLDDCFKTMRVKGADYTGKSKDILKNFREAGADAGVKTEQAWLIFFNKHYSAIKSFVQFGKVESEPIEGRIKDCIVYLLLFFRMAQEIQGPATQRLKALTQQVDQQLLRDAIGKKIREEAVEGPAFRPLMKLDLADPQGQSPERLSSKERLDHRHEPPF